MSQRQAVVIAAFGVTCDRTTAPRRPQPLWRWTGQANPGRFRLQAV